MQAQGWQQRLGPFDEPCLSRYVLSAWRQRGVQRATRLTSAQGARRGTSHIESSICISIYLSRRVPFAELLLLLTVHRCFLVVRVLPESLLKASTGISFYR